LKTNEAISLQRSGGQKSRSHDAEVRFGDLTEASSSFFYFSYRYIMTYLHSHVGLQNPDISIPVANLTPASDSAHLLKKGIVAFCRDMKAIVADFDSFCTEFAFREGVN